MKAGKMEWQKERKLGSQMDEEMEEPRGGLKVKWSARM